MHAKLKNFFPRYAVQIFATCLSMLHLPAHSYVECNVTPSRIYVDEAVIWIIWKEGGVSLVGSGNSAYKSYLSLLLTASVSGKSMTARYPDGASCTTSPPSYITGLWLNN